MTTHTSAIALETPHVTEIDDALKQRAHAVLNDISIDPRWRAIIWYALEINDPWLPDLVQRANSGERFAESIDFSLAPHNC